FYGNTIIDPNIPAKAENEPTEKKESSEVDNNTKISDLKGKSMMFNNVMLDMLQDEGAIVDENRTDITLNSNNEFDKLLDQFFLKSDLKVIKTDKLAEMEYLYHVERPSLIADNYLVMVTKDKEPVSLKQIEQLHQQMKSDAVEKGVFIT